MTHLEDRCTACRFALIPGITACVNCGEPVPETARDIVDTILGMATSYEPPDPAVLDRWRRENAEGNRQHRRLMEARALEYATDIDGALAIYEEFVAAGTHITVPYQRAAILYKRRKQLADEERVVRAGIASCSTGASSWFVLRLAKILAEQRAGKRSKPAP